MMILTGDYAESWKYFSNMAGKKIAIFCPSYGSVFRAGSLRKNCGLNDQRNSLRDKKRWKWKLSFYIFNHNSGKTGLHCS